MTPRGGERQRLRSPAAPSVSLPPRLRLPRPGSPGRRARPLGRRAAARAGLGSRWEMESGDYSLSLDHQLSWKNFTTLDTDVVTSHHMQVKISALHKTWFRVGDAVWSLPNGYAWCQKVPKKFDVKTTQKCSPAPLPGCRVRHFRSQTASDLWKFFSVHREIVTDNWNCRGLIIFPRIHSVHFLAVPYGRTVKQSGRW